MKKIVVLSAIYIFALAVFTVAAKDAEKHSHDSNAIHKLMHARQAWLVAMTRNLDAKKFDAVAKDADALSEQTRDVGEKHPNPLGKEITLAISTLAKDIAMAAASQNSEAVKGKLGEIKAKCGECHAKFRDKK